MRRARILILARPGPVREGLRALFSSLPEVAAVRCVDSLAAAERLARRRPPAIICVEAAGLGRALPEVLEQLARQAPRAARVILAESDERWHSVEACFVLLLGAPPAVIVRTVEELLAEAGGRAHGSSS